MVAVKIIQELCKDLQMFHVSVITKFLSPRRTCYNESKFAKFAQDIFSAY